MENTMAYHEIESTVQQYSESQQNKWGDSLTQKSIIELPARTFINIRSNPLDELKVIWKEWTPARRLKFSQTYGHIGFLLHVSVNIPAIKALVEFWNPPYRCFTMNGIYLTPTIEEYTSLLHLVKLQTPYKPYVHDASVSFVKEMYDAVRVKIQKTFSEGGAEVRKISWKQLKEIIEKEEKEEVQIHMMALAIYGLIIFPKELNMIDQATVSFVAQVRNGINPVQGILAETFRSLNNCRIRRRERLKCCVQLLYVWMVGHLSSNKGGFRSIFSMIRIPLAEFEDTQLKEQLDKSKWNTKMCGLIDSGVTWLAPWMVCSNMIYRCGNLPWVPLLGPWGGIAYAPLMVRRQLGASQFVPMTHGLADSDFAYETGDTRNQIRKFMVAWKHVNLIDPSDGIATVQGNYEAWRENRVNPQLKRIPEIVIEHIKSPSACMQLKPQGDPCPVEKGDARAEVGNQQKEALVSVYRKEIKRQRIRYIQSEEEVVALRKERRRLRAALGQKSQMLEDAHTEVKKKSLYIQELERQGDEQRSKYNQVLEKIEPCIMKADYWEAKFRALHKKST
ncbi:uncharacterized protein LOC131144964 [Malania oleifera]|uniref:uncharacterized protein LOC131144964 n=1 Tax=Malania oleifera TaxID=397392 RepID=UPI0025AEC6B0|nr:uncharacterized protein LOC131144964 [Malania oleifera]